MRRLRCFPFSPNYIFTEKTVDTYVTIFHGESIYFFGSFIPFFRSLISFFRTITLSFRGDFFFSPSLFSISSVKSAMTFSLSCLALTYLFLRLR